MRLILDTVTFIWAAPLTCGETKPSTFTKASRSYGDWMHEQRLLTVGVECNAGHRGEQTPRTLILGDRRIAVAELLDAWLAPDHRYFKLKGEDGDTYLVRHDEQRGIWELTMFRADRKALGFRVI